MPWLSLGPALDFRHSFGIIFWMTPHLTYTGRKGSSCRNDGRDRSSHIKDLHCGDIGDAPVCHGVGVFYGSRSVSREDAFADPSDPSDGPAACSGGSASVEAVFSQWAARL